MDSNSWIRLPASSKRHQSTLRTRFGEKDMYLVGYDEFDGEEEESKAEFPCPFCSEDFDLVELCFHIDDEHPVEAKNGICPICAARVGTDIVGHITMQHGSFFKMQRRRRNRRGSLGSHSTLSLLRKDLREGGLNSLFGGSSFAVPPSSTAPDPLLSSFIANLPADDLSKDVQPAPLDDKSIAALSSEDKVVESVQPPIPEEDLEERTRRCQFVQGMVLSTLFEDYL